MKRIIVKKESGAIVAQMDLEDSEAQLQIIRAGAPDFCFRKYGNVILTVEDIGQTCEDMAAAARARRHENYPSVGDQLDALYKSRHGDSSALEELDSRIANIKARFPVLK